MCLDLMSYTFPSYFGHFIKKLVPANYIKLLCKDIDNYIQEPYISGHINN